MFNKHFLQDVNSQVCLYTHIHWLVRIVQYARSEQNIKACELHCRFLSNFQKAETLTLRFYADPSILPLLAQFGRV